MIFFRDGIFLLLHFAFTAKQFWMVFNGSLTPQVKILCLAFTETMNRTDREICTDTKKQELG
jgi:hypothetical protein